MAQGGPVKRSMMIAGHATSISLEPVFWEALREAAEAEELPLNALKIDQSFVRRMAADGRTEIVGSVIELAHALEMEVIAEGVEEPETAEVLHELGAEYLQGYHFSRPIPPADLIEWANAPEPARS